MWYGSHASPVDRWHRDGLARCWRHRARRPGRPRIDPACQDLIRRMAAENCLWGCSADPRRITGARHRRFGTHRLAVSARPSDHTRSQTWRTFFANLLGERTWISPVMFADARSNDIVVDASDVSCRRTPRAIDALCVSSHAANVDWCRSLQQSSLDLRPGHDHLQDRTGARRSTGQDPPQASTLRWPGGIRQVSFLRAHSATATKRRARSFAASATGFAMGNSGIALPAQSSYQHRPKAEHFIRPRMVVCDVIRTAIGILAKHSRNRSCCRRR